MSQPIDYLFQRGNTPLFITMPHVGTAIPDDIAQTMTPEALTVPDTDWHIEKLYAFATALGASVLQANWSRYVVDLNRPPDDASLYPGQATTSLCPVTRFDGGAIYRAGCEPDAQQIAYRRRRYWQPWHDKVQQTLNELRQQFPVVVLWDAHSIRSVLPQFFEGKLPDFNIGTNDGVSCSPDLQARIATVARKSTSLTSVENGRYRGGYITRHYAAPAQGVHALQMELAQSAYMDENPPWEWRAEQAQALQGILEEMLQNALAFTR
ncbi:N-formylglutamate deformylase [Pectobacterium cacticida]|uniref:N-formylglutamate deformylase n=1 Tax=Pectobacterium cacticida TaxID=69221 RepID=A0ABZ2G4V9_9GAMM|nr:N-formylglutamate deformylase [Pectobacterium cacticida]UYX05426.1 N-formylglutamate deformylase [Pectobacterium cacticida]